MLKVASRAVATVAPRVKTASTRFGPALSVVTDSSRIEQRQHLQDDNRFGFSTTVRWSSSSSSPGGKKREPAIRMDTHLQHSVHDGTLRDKMRTREPVVGVMTSFQNDTDHVEMIGLMGYDFVWANATSSSTAANPDSIKSIILAAERRGMPTLVQMGQGYHNIVGHANTYLAAGAQGIILQQCESKADVMKLVDVVKFPPLGKRVMAKERWNGWCLGDTSLSLSDAMQASNDNTIIAVVIETQKGIDALDEILTVEELDFVFVSPTNLSVAKIDDAGEKIRKANKSSGTLTMNNNTKEDYITWRNLGFNVMCTSAQSMFFDGARHMMNVIVEHEGIKDLKAIRSSKIEYQDESDSSSSDSEDDGSEKESEAAAPTQPPPKPAMPVPDLSDAECLKSATMKVIASKMDSHEVASLQEMFDLIDTNGDGDLQLEEIEDVIEDGGFNRHLTAKLESIRDNMIENNQDVLYWKKYLLESLDEDVYLNDDNIQKAYDHLKESCGTMNVEGLTKAFGDEELTRKVLNVVDTNHDGEIQFEEFRDAVNKLMASADGDDDNNKSETKRKLGEW